MNELKTIAITNAANRRGFMLRSLATGLGLHGIATVNASAKRSADGRTFVEGAVIPNHPFSPERVVVMRNSRADGRRLSDDRVEATLGACLRLRFHLPMDKVNVILHLMRALTDYYRVPHLFDDWATGLAGREGLGSASIAGGFAMFHQFQRVEHMRQVIPSDVPRAVLQQNGNLKPLRLATSPIDWWLILCPEGIDWESPDGQPVYGMIGHVFPSDYFDFPGTTMRTYCLTDAIGRVIGIDPIDNWARIARMDKAIAARAINQVVLARYHSELELLIHSRDSKPG